MLATGFTGKEAKSRAIPPAFVVKQIAERTHRSLGGWPLNAIVEEFSDDACENIGRCHFFSPVVEGKVQF